VANAFRSVEDLLQWQGWLRHKVVDAVEVADPDGVLQQYRAALADYPADLAIEVARRSLTHLRTEFLADWNFRNPFHYAYSLSEMLEHLGRALFALNRRFYAPPFKHWQHDLPTLRPDISAELLQLIGVPDAAGLPARREVLQRTVATLEQALEA
jgi:hypothetical protein